MNHPKEFAEGLSIGIIMDGNGRWAKQRGLPRTAGHKKGAAVFQDIANYCEELGVSSVTFYAFSTENWKRPLEEVSAIMKLFGEYLLKGFNYKDRNIRIKFLGDRAALDAKLQKLMNELEEDSAAKTGMTLNIAVNYGGRPEIVRAARQLAQQVAEGTLKPEDITEEMMSDHMYTAGQKDPDFILRPSGEKRLSNFMLWQAAYAELVEMDVLWPDFTRDDLDAAITLIAIHEVFKALGFGRKEWPMYAVFVPYTLLIMLSSYQVWRRLVMPASFLMVLFFGIYLVVRNAQVDFAKASGLVMFSGIVIFCFYSFIRLKELLPVETYGYDAMFFILLILCFAWGGDTCAYFAGRAFGKHKLCPVVSPKKTVEGAIGGVLGTMVFGVIATVIYSIAANRMEAFTRTNIGVSMYVIIALLACVAAVLGIYGDLFASVVKRQCGIKDYGTIFPGHGGILDRFDSVMFIAPFVTMVVIAVFYH